MQLDGLRVAVLRVGDGRDAIADGLASLGATVRTLRVADVHDHDDDEVVMRVGALGDYAWVAVTSRHAARRLVLWSSHWPGATRIAAVSDATSATVRSLGLACDATAPDGTSRGLAATIDDGPVCFLAASNASGELDAALAARSIEVRTVVVYDLIARALSDADRATLRESDVVVAMAPSAFDAMAALGHDDQARARRIPLVAFGPSTAAEGRERGWPVAGLAATRDASGVAAAIAPLLGR
jgi:uroporphyrinogen-III synthase